MTSRELVTIAKATVREFRKDDVGTMAAALTYYFFFSLFPLLIIAITITRVFIKDEAAALIAVNSNVRQVLPGAAKLVSDAVDAAFRNRTAAGFLAVVGVVTLLWSASGAFDALDKAINRAWKAARVSGLLLTKLTSLGMMLVLVGIMLASFIFTTILTTGRALTMQTFGEVPGTDVLWQIANFGTSVLVIFIVFFLMYRFLPRTDVIARDVVLGAFLAALIWSLLKEVFAYYLGSNFANYDAVYGTLGTVVALLTWIYLSSIIILVGAEFTAETARVRRLRLLASGDVLPNSEKPRAANPWLPRSRE